MRALSKLGDAFALFVMGGASLAFAVASAGVSEAVAAPGLTAPVLVAQHAGCMSLAGDLIDWTELLGPKRHRYNALSSHLAELSQSGVSDETTFDSGAGFPECSELAASQSAGAEVLARSQRAQLTFTPVVNEPLWLARPGAVAGPVGLLGLEPTIAMAPDGSGVLAWLEYTGQRRRGEQVPGEEPPRYGPAFTVQAARISATGQLGATQTIAGPSAGYGLGEAAEPLPESPVAYADPDGTLAVAYSLLAPNSESSLVQVSEASPGQPFAAPQTLLGEAAKRSPVPEDQLGIAGDANGSHVVQWQIGGEHTIESALQGSPAQPFAGAFAVPFLREEAQLYGTLMDESGETLSLLEVPSGVSEGAAGALAVVRLPPGGIGESIEYLVPAQAHERAEGAHLAVQPDGLAAAVWVAALVSPNGGSTSRVMLATAPPGGPFGAAAPVTGLAPLAGESAVAFDPSGALHIAWTVEERELSGRVLAVSAQPGATDPLSLPGPRVTLHARRMQQSAHGLFVTVRVDRPCLVRLQAVASARATERGMALGFERTEASHEFAAAGTARLHIPEVPANDVRGKPPMVRVLAYASSPSEASSIASLRVPVLPARAFAP
jgi:hypothetical protein